MQGPMIWTDGLRSLGDEATPAPPHPETYGVPQHDPSPSIFGTPRQQQGAVARQSRTHPQPERITSALPDDTSSDEWTGDEDFLPSHSARRKHRQARLLRKQQQQRGEDEAPETPIKSIPAKGEGPQSVAFQERLKALRSPGAGATASRFQRCGIVPGPRPNAIKIEAPPGHTLERAASTLALAEVEARPDSPLGSDGKGEAKSMASGDGL